MTIRDTAKDMLYAITKSQAVYIELVKAIARGGPYELLEQEWLDCRSEQDFASLANLHELLDVRGKNESV